MSKYNPPCNCDRNYIQILDIEGGQSFNDLVGEVASFGAEFGAIGYQVINTAPTIFSVATAGSNPNGSNATSITIAQLGTYKFFVDFTAGMLGGNSRTELTMRFERNGVSVPGGLFRLYQRTTGYDMTASLHIRLNDVAAGDVFTVRGSVTNGVGVPISTLDGSRWSISRIE